LGTGKIRDVGRGQKPRSNDCWIQGGTDKRKNPHREPLKWQDKEKGNGEKKKPIEKNKKKTSVTKEKQNN